MRLHVEKAVESHPGTLLLPQDVVEDVVEHPQEEVVPDRDQNPVRGDRRDVPGRRVVIVITGVAVIGLRRGLGVSAIIGLWSRLAIVRIWLGGLDVVVVWPSGLDVVIGVGLGRLDVIIRIRLSRLDVVIAGLGGLRGVVRPRSGGPGVGFEVQCVGARIQESGVSVKGVGSRA